MTKGFPSIHPTLRRIVICTAAAALLQACSSPLTPTALDSLSDGRGGSAVSSATEFVASRRLIVPFPLLNGTFTISFRTADGTTGTVSGTYTGEAVAAIPGNTTATLDLHITQTTGAGSLITGLEATGSGAFVDEGAFTLSLKLESSVKMLDGAKVTFRATTQLSCSASHQIHVTQLASDSTPRFPEISIDFQHEVGNTACSAR